MTDKVIDIETKRLQYRDTDYWVEFIALAIQEEINSKKLNPKERSDVLFESCFQLAFMYLFANNGHITIVEAFAAMSDALESALGFETDRRE